MNIKDRPFDIDLVKSNLAASFSYVCNEKGLLKFKLTHDELNRYINNIIGELDELKAEKHVVTLSDDVLPIFQKVSHDNPISGDAITRCFMLVITDAFSDYMNAE